MAATSTFDNAPARDEEGRIVVKSTCCKCGAFELVSVRNGSLKRWESQHACPGVPKIPLKFSDGES